MFFKRLKLLLAAVCLAAPASAATYDFSFSNVNGGTPGVVSGTITLADGDGVFSASSIIVDAAPAGLGYTTVPFDVIASATGLFENSFTVTGGVIDLGASVVTLYFDAGTPTPSSFGLNNAAFGSLLSNIGVQITTVPVGVVDLANATLAYSSVTPVPVPAGLPLLGGALAAFALLRRRAKAYRKGAAPQGAAPFVVL